MVCIWRKTSVSYGPFVENLNVCGGDEYVRHYIDIK